MVILLVTSLLIEVYFEILGPTGLYLVALNIGNNLHKLQTGYLYHYTLLILIGITSLVGIRQIWLLYEFFVDYRLLLLIFILIFILSSFNSD